MVGRWCLLRAPMVVWMACGVADEDVDGVEDNDGFVDEEGRCDKGSYHRVLNCLQTLD